MPDNHSDTPHIIEGRKSSICKVNIGFYIVSSISTSALIVSGRIRTCAGGQSPNARKPLRHAPHTSWVAGFESAWAVKAHMPDNHSETPHIIKGRKSSICKANIGFYIVILNKALIVSSRIQTCAGKAQMISSHVCGQRSHDSYSSPTLRPTHLYDFTKIKIEFVSPK